MFCKYEFSKDLNNADLLIYFYEYFMLQVKVYFFVSPFFMTFTVLSRSVKWIVTIFELDNAEYRFQIYSYGENWQRCIQFGKLFNRWNHTTLNTIWKINNTLKQFIWLSNIKESQLMFTYPLLQWQK